MSKNSFLQIIEEAPADPILGLTEAFKKDSNPEKVNLGVGVYLDENGRVPVLKTIRDAEARWYDQEDSKAYLPIDGAAEYNKAVQKLILGRESRLLATGQVITVQSLGGTGALKVGADFLKKFYPSSDVYISDPSWANHQQLFEFAGITVKTYPYYDSSTRGLKFDEMCRTIESLPSRSIVLLHGCCHNPTGVDLSHEQWKKLAGIFKESDLIPYFDFAYQGFAEGIDEDAFAIRVFAEENISFLVASSFSKNLSMYRERVGALTLVAGSEDEVEKSLSQIKRIIRTNYSNPASHGAQAACIVLSDPELRDRWHDEVAAMRERIKKMRERFVQGLRDNGVQQDFSFITSQNGMFSFTGLNRDQVARLINEYGIYIVGSGRVCVAAMNEKNLPNICRAIAAVLGKS